MKTVNRICQILSIIFAVVSLILFFTPFATIATNNGDVSMVGAALGFGSKIDLAGTEYDMAKSADILFCFWLTVLGVVLSVFSFKSKKVRYFAPALALGTGIYMLVIALSDATKFVDARPLTTTIGVTSIEYASSVLFTAIALLLFAVAAAAYLLIDDYIEVTQSKGAKRTILKRVIGFFKDYKSEIKKIVWPGFKDVAKNTGIVLAMCLIVGAFIWLLDLGLGKLIELIL
ncbi:MAG: preprotein translocase subunit SecE [Acutalibacteraceae bacterium]|nr:preprotein translocase subunit SecE [Acutalibacteraceae bacterium]